MTIRVDNTWKYYKLVLIIQNKMSSIQNYDYNIHICFVKPLCNLELSQKRLKCI